MAIDPNTQKQISTFIGSQFPRLYEEYGQTFIDFVTAYYVWMETQGPLYDSRRASEYQDIDTTVAKFIVYFKDKYLPNIQLETKSNVDLLVKHSLDVYRSRGTIRSIDLLFRLVFGVGADVYYPFDDVLQPSSGDWFIPRYLEVSTQDDLDKFVGKEIVGVTSGAQAFVESWVRKKAGSKQIDILYISALEGDFTTGERINTFNNPFDLLKCPTMIGSLSSVIISSGGINFKVGDLVPIQGTVGYSGVGRVANVAQTTGTVSFALNDGGYGYTANALVLMSDTVLTVANISPGANVVGGPNYFTIFETVSQPLANINYQSAVGGTTHFTNNDIITTYFGNGSVQGTGIVLSSVNGTSTNGQIFVAVLSGNLQSNAIYNAGNVVSANVPVANGYFDKTATGNVISESQTAFLTFNNRTGTFIRSEILTNGPGTSATIDSIVINGPAAQAAMSQRRGVWTTGTTVTGQSSGATANLVSVTLNVGLKNLVNSFTGDSRAPIKTSYSGTSGQIPVLNQGTGASFQVSPLLSYPENVLLNTDFILPYAGIALNAANYGFPVAGTETLTTLLATALSTVTYTIGKITALTGFTPGTGYTVPPLCRIYEPIIFSQRKIERQVLTITGASGAFSIGDVVTQAATGARALILSGGSSQLIMQKISLLNTFVATSNSTTVIVATATGTTANVTIVEDAQYFEAKDIGQTYLGFDFQVTATTSAANGTITNLQVLSSGWGYEPGETLTITANNISAIGHAVLNKQGLGTGFYRNDGGFLSGNKKIQDNNYYQVSAYDVKTSVAFDHYKDMLKALLHVAGTKAFGTFVYKTTATVPINILHAKITQA